MSNVVILNFSGKENGNCSCIADYISEKYTRTNVRNIRIADYFSPCGRCEYECLQQGAICPRIGDDHRTIMESICTCDVAYYLIPNYCGLPCANYYAFNERIVGWFNGDRKKMQCYLGAKKKFIFISNTENEAFRQVTKQHATKDAEILYLASRKYSKNSIAGDLLQSNEAKSDLDCFLSSDAI